MIIKQIDGKGNGNITKIIKIILMNFSTRKCAYGTVQVTHGTSGFRGTVQVAHGTSGFRGTMQITHKTMKVSYGATGFRGTQLEYI
jgi:hypothetical protein